MIALDGAKLAIYGAIAAALLAAGFAAGHRWQAGEVADAEKAQAAAEADRDKWKAAAGEWERAQGLWAARYEQEQADAKRQREQAARLLAEAAREEAKAAKDAAAWRTRFQAAQRDPDCAELMETTTCAAFTGY